MTLFKISVIEKPNDILANFSKKGIKKPSKNQFKRWLLL